MGKNKLKGETASIVEFVCGGLLVVSGLSQFVLNAWTALACLFFGLFLIVQGLQWRVLIKDYKAYSALLSADPTGSIPNLAAATKASAKEVKTSLTLMIKKGLMENAAIDEQGNRVVIGCPPPTGSPVSTQPPIVAEAISIECKGCGAGNKVAKGSTAKCEHCGADISA